MVSLYAPTGQFGCLTISLGKLTITAGFVPEMLGLDIAWGSCFVFTTARYDF
jgi:hypothetical protein